MIVYSTTAQLSVLALMNSILQCGFCSSFHEQTRGLELEQKISRPTAQFLLELGKPCYPFSLMALLASVYIIHEGTDQNSGSHRSIDTEGTTRSHPNLFANR